jgi:hypothetical protein
MERELPDWAKDYVDMTYSELFDNFDKTDRFV